MVELRERRIYIDGEPRIVVAGEVHYFRLMVSEWRDRLLKAKALGCNAIATYIPWLFHEEIEGEIDLVGKTRRETDLGKFIDLCHELGMWFIARPGPFVMAEMKNEGIPYWVAERHPDVVPISWDGKRAESKNLDYLSSDFLEASRNWYRAVIPVIAERLIQRGGPVIGIQLDNEIGMLAWVTNQPDLSDDTLCQFAEWLITNDLDEGYGIDLNDPSARAKSLRTPSEAIAPKLVQDYGSFERFRYARYVRTLRGYAEEFGISGIPFTVNIHGSGGGRGQQFPIGISQLYESYAQADGYLSGSDHYLGDLTRENYQDLYLINAFMAAVARPEQPISSLEFEVGTGDYGETGAIIYSGSAADHKVRMSFAQGNRLLNYYLLSGGRNPKLLKPRGDGNDRIAATGERHGFAAPINPEGEMGANYRALKATTDKVLAIQSQLSTLEEEFDDVSIGFIPDYYKTNLRRPGKSSEIVENLEYIRGPLEVLSRGMLQLGLRFPAVDIQHRTPKTKRLAIASSRHMAQEVQQRLVDYMRGGASVLFWGEFPIQDMIGNPCLILADALGLKPGRFAQGTGDYFPSTAPSGILADEPELRVWRMQTMVGAKEVFLRHVGTDEPVGFTQSLGSGKAIAVLGNYACHMNAFHRIFDALGAQPALTAATESGGVFVTSGKAHGGGRIVTLINLDVEPKSVELRENGSRVTDVPVELGPRGALFIPVGLQFGSVEVVWATTECQSLTEERLVFSPNGGNAAVLVRGKEVKSHNARKSDHRHGTLLYPIDPKLPIELEI